MEAVFAAAGCTSVAPAPHFGAECWFAVKCSTGAGVVGHWRASDWENEATLVHRLHSKFPGSFPALLDVLPADDGALLVYSAVPGVSLAELVSGHSGRLPLPVILALGESLARAIALSHSARVMIGTLNARYVIGLCIKRQFLIPQLHIPRTCRASAVWL